MTPADIHTDSHSLKPLYRRIKRHVVGKAHWFFAASSPGLETLCMKELQTIIPDCRELVAVEGGAEFKGRLTDAYVFNLHSRIANRILMRLKSFKATNFKQLEKKMLQLPWELYLVSADGLTFNISTRHSRLYHTGAVEETCHGAIFDRMAKYGQIQVERPGSTIPQHIFIRVLDDRFIISMDSTGDHLYKRGIKKHSAKAPIRETLAAAALMLADHDPKEPLVDPMCGSGTFAVEAAMMAKKIPAGWFRNFAFQGWPAFRPRQWEYIRNTAKGEQAEISRPIVFASDKDTQAIHRLRNRVRQFGLSDAACLFSKDFFDIYPEKFLDRTGLVMINPPYGRRIALSGNQNRFYKDVFEKLLKDFRGWKMGLFVPEKRVVKACPFRVRVHPFFHGGLELMLITGRIPPSPNIS